MLSAFTGAICVFVHVGYLCSDPPFFFPRLNNPPSLLVRPLLLYEPSALDILSLLVYIITQMIHLLYLPEVTVH